MLQVILSIYHIIFLPFHKLLTSMILTSLLLLFSILIFEDAGLSFDILVLIICSIEFGDIALCGYLFFVSNISTQQFRLGLPILLRSVLFVSRLLWGLGTIDLAGREIWVLPLFLLVVFIFLPPLVLIDFILNIFFGSLDLALDSVLFLCSELPRSVKLKT